MVRWLDILDWMDISLSRAPGAGGGQEAGAAVQGLPSQRQLVARPD